MKKLLLVSTVIGSLLAGSVAFAATPPTLSISGGNTPYSTISVSGTGFQPGELVQVQLGLNATTTVADASGSFSGVSLQIPNLPAGLYLVLAIGKSSGIPAFTYLYVQSLYPLASPSAWYIPPGSTLTWSGSGYLPNEQITVKLGTTTLATFSADSSGSFADAGASVVPFSLRNSTATYTLTSTGSGITSTYHISIANLYPYANPSTWYALPGTPVTFSGAGFGAGESVSIYQGASTTPLLAHIATDSSGAFSGAGPILLPYHTPSPVGYRIVGDASGATAMVPITLAQFYPTLSPSAYYAAPGSSITLGGSGFAPNEVVDITAGSATSTATTDAAGTFSGISLHLPPTPNTNLTVNALGETSGASSSFVMTIGAYYSWMTLSSYWAPGGSPLIVFGHNFAGGEDITLTSGSQTLGTTTAANDGSFTASLAVPFAPSGPATITATGLLSGAVANSTMTIAPVYTDLRLKQYYGAPGTAVEFIGHGYLPNEPISLMTDRTASSTVASWSADASGNFDYTGYTIPGSFAEGNLTLTVTGAHSFDSKSIVYYVTGS